MSVTIKVTRKEQLFQKLRRSVPKVEDGLEAANEASAEEMADMMRRFVPVKTGALRDSITVTHAGERTPKGRLVPEGAAMVTAGNKVAFYGSMVEFGTVRLPAQPFFWPSFRALRKRAKSRASRAMTKAIKAS